MLTVPICPLTIPSPLGFSKDATGQTLAPTLTAISPTDDVIAFYDSCSNMATQCSMQITEQTPLGALESQLFSLGVFFFMYFPMRDLAST